MGMVTDTDVADILFALLRWGLHTEVRNDRPIESRRHAYPISPLMWREVYTLASAQGVLAVAWDGLQRLAAEEKLSADQQPDRTLKIQWAYNVDCIEKRYARQKRVISRLADFYCEHGMGMMLLKGYGLSMNYPVPEHRPCGDIDIWLFGRQRDADEALRKESGVDIDEEKHHHTTFTLDGIMVENHYDFLNIHSHASNREIDERLKRLAATQTGERIEVDGRPVFLPPPDLNALFLLRHSAVHFAAAEIGLRHVVDWALFVKKYAGGIDWAALERVAREQNMHRFLHSLNAICIDRLGVDSGIFPPFERDEELETRVLNDILCPEFPEPAPKDNIAGRLCWKLRRWWFNRWKHRIVYREGLFRTFFVQLKSHLMKPESF